MDAYTAADIERLKQELGLRGVVERMAKDPVFAAAFNAHAAESKQASDRTAAAEESRWPATVTKVPVGGRGLEFIGPKLSIPLVVRFVGEMEILVRHWNANNGPACAGRDCCLCPSGDRKIHGYADAILREPGTHAKKPELYRAIVSIPGAAMDALEGRSLRGLKVVFLMPKKGVKTSTEILEETCPVPLPEPLDIRPAIMRRWLLTAWPDYTPAAELPTIEEEAAPREILKFKKLA